MLVFVFVCMFLFVFLLFCIGGGDSGVVVFVVFCFGLFFRRFWGCFLWVGCLFYGFFIIILGVGVICFNR